MGNRVRKGSGPRRMMLLGAFALGFTALLARAVDLQVLQRDFLQGEGNARHLRTLPISAHRGAIIDRNGEIMAVSTPVDAVWANPREVLAEPGDLDRLAGLIEMDPVTLRQRLESRANREFVYLRRQVTPDVAAQVVALGIAGIGLRREYRRYYPMGEVAAHVLGFTNIDDRGQEGLELAFDRQLTGEPGARRVLQDRYQRVIRDIENIRAARPGETLQLTIDQRLQYLAYRELKAAVQLHGARAGSAIIMDVRTGDVLAMVNQPSFNPNNRDQLQGDRTRNRVVTDLFEPGSTIKPFTVAAALESGQFDEHSMIETSPGRMRVGSHTIRDFRNYGLMDLSTVLGKSSNVGVSKLALAIEPSQLWDTYNRVGFGRRAGIEFPGEAGGVLRDFFYWRNVDRAIIAYGYGLSINLLQLAQAYGVLANKGVMVQPRIILSDSPPREEQVMDPSIAQTVLGMMEKTVTREGTGMRAAVHGYKVAGKTGTARKSSVGGYTDRRYVSLFAGAVPASDPQLVMVVMIDEPVGDEYYGGLVAAPVFSRVMQGALRLLDIPPDDIEVLRAVSPPSRGGNV